MVVLVLFGCIIYNSSITYNTSWMVMSLYIMDSYVMIYHGSTNPDLYDMLYYIS